MDELSELFEREYPFILNYCYKRIGDWQDAEDLAQTTFERALSVLPHPNPRALLLSIAWQRVCGYRRRQRQRRTRVFADVFDPERKEDHSVVLAIGDQTDRIVEWCDAAVALPRLRAALAECALIDVQIVDLRYVQEYSAVEVQRILGISKGEYSHRHHALMNRLAQRLDPTPPPPKKPQIRRAVCEECGDRHYSRGRCIKHYAQLRAREQMARRKQIGLAVAGTNVLQ